LAIVAYVIAALAGFVFGAADQYLGSRESLGAWAWTLSGMSAPWLVLPFLAGLTQERGRCAMSLGVIATFTALAGYFVLTCSPMENVALERFSSCFQNMATSGYNPLWILGAAIFGPLGGLLGQRWRVNRSWTSVAFVACALCLEPAARLVVGSLAPVPVVWWTEVSVGILVAGMALITSGTSRAESNTGT